MQPNLDLVNIVTLVKAQVLQAWLTELNYCPIEVEYLVKGFTEGFDLEYDGPWDRQDVSNNIPLQHQIGNESDLWDKIAKEVNLNRLAGPFEQPPKYNHPESQQPNSTDLSLIIQFW